MGLHCHNRCLDGIGSILSSRLAAHNTEAKRDEILFELLPWLPRRRRPVNDIHHIAEVISNCAATLACDKPHSVDQPPVRRLSQAEALLRIRSLFFRGELLCFHHVALQSATSRLRITEIFR